MLFTPVATAVTEAPGTSVAPHVEQPPVQPSQDPTTAPPEQVLVPIVGRVAAGAPILAEEHIEGSFPLPSDDLGPGTFFMLHVVGWSMYEAGIFPDDLVIVRQQQAAADGDIVVARLEGEGPEGAVTVKFLSEKPGLRRLLPANPSEQPIDGWDGQMEGKVVGVLRWLRATRAPFTQVGRRVAPVVPPKPPREHL